MSGTRVSQIVDERYLGKPIYSGDKAKYIKQYFKDHPQTNYCNTLKTATDPKLKDNFSVLYDRNNNTYWIKYFGFKNNPGNILGLGGHAGEHQTRVKLVQNMITGQWRAIKIVKNSINENTNIYNKSLSQYECDIANILNLDYSFIETNTSLCIIQPIRDGFDLYDFLMRYPNLSFSIRLTVAISLLEEVKKFHDNNIIHRDIKLENFVIDKNQQAHLIDFTSAIKRLSIRPDNQFATFLYGTLGYHHPDISQGYQSSSSTRVYSDKSDLYATLICVAVCLGFCTLEDNTDVLLFKEGPHPDEINSEIYSYLKLYTDKAKPLNSLPTDDNCIRFFTNIQNRLQSSSDRTSTSSTEKKRKQNLN